MLRDPSFDVLFKNKALFMRSELAVQQQQDNFKAGIDLYRLSSGPNDSQDPCWKPVKPTHQSLFPTLVGTYGGLLSNFSLFIPPHVMRKGKKGQRLVRGPVILELVFKPHHRTPAAVDE